MTICGHIIHDNFYTLAGTIASLAVRITLFEFFIFVTSCSEMVNTFSHELFTNNVSS